MADAYFSNMSDTSLSDHFVKLALLTGLTNTSNLSPETFATTIAVPGGGGPGGNPAVVPWGGGACNNANTVPGVDFDLRMQIA